MFYLVDSLIYFIVYIGLFIGVWLILYPIISRIINRVKVLNRFRLLRINNRSRKRNSKLYSHIELLLSVTFGIKSRYSIITFFLASILLFGVSLTLLFTNNIHNFPSILVSITLGLFPYIILKIKLHNIRISSSYEATYLITELINQYKINHFNMIEAIDKTIPRLDKQPYSKKSLFRLSISIKQYRGKDELWDLINEFNYSISTSWSLLLANNIFLSIEYGDDVTEALNDILEDLIDLKRINEKNKQYNHETYLMIKYIAPGFYLLSVIAMFGIFGFTFDKFIEFQFNTPTGLKFFILILFSISINYVIYFLIKRPKNDY